MTRAKLALITAALVTAATAAGCEQEQAKVVGALEATWTTNDPTGQPERVKFGGGTVIYAFETDAQYTCPYRLRSYHEERNVLEIKIRCKQRVGVDAWVNHSLQFEPDHGKFVASVEGQPAAVYSRQ